jgi:hypothetical protein
MKAVVEEKLGEGGQGAVYRVDYNGKPKALNLTYLTRRFRCPGRG